MSEWEDEDPGGGDGPNLDAEEKLNKLLEDRLKIRKQTADTLKEELDDLKAYDAKLQNLVQGGKGLVAQTQSRVNIAKKEQELAIEMLKEGKIGLVDGQAEIEQKTIALNLEEQKLKALKRSEENLKRNVAQARAFGNELASAILPLQKSKFFNLDFAKKLMGTLTSGAAGFGKALAGFSLGIVENLIGGMIDMAFELDNMRSAMQKTGIISQERAYQIAEESKETSNLFVTTEAYQKSFLGLLDSYQEFSMMSTEVQKKATRLAAVMDRFGVSADTLGKSMQNVTKVTGLSGNAATDAVASMYGLANTLGVTVKQVTEDFNAMMPSLAKLGPTAVDSFREMARVAKITGLEMQKLLNMTDKFDTFEGAAEQVGKMNAALGGNFLNAMDLMMETDPVGRFEQMRGALEDAGLEFDSMSYYQRKFFAESMGLENVADLAKVMSGDMSKFGGEVGKTAADYKKMEEEAAKAASIQEKFKGFLADIMKTLVDSDMLQKINDLFDQFSQGEGPLIELKNTLVDLGESIKNKIIPAIEFFTRNWERFAIIFGTIKGMQLLIYLGQMRGAIMANVAVQKANVMWMGIQKEMQMQKVAADLAEEASIASKVAAEKAATVVTKGSTGSKLASIEATIASDLATKREAAAKLGTIPVDVAATTSTTTLATAKGFLAGAITMVGKASLATKVMMVTGIIGALIILAQVMMMASPSLLVAAIIALGIAFYLLGPSLNSLIVPMNALTMPMLAMGAAAFLIGAGIGIAAAGLSLFMGSLALIPADQLFAIAAALYAMGSSFYMVASGLALMANPLSLAGIGSFVLLFAGITIALEAAGGVFLSIVEALATLFVNIGDLSLADGVGAEFEAIADGLASIALTDALSFGIVGDVKDMFTEAAKFAESYSGGGRGGGGGGAPSTIKVQLDAAATKDFLQGLVAEASAEAIG